MRKIITATVLVLTTVTACTSGKLASSAPQTPQFSADELTAIASLKTSLTTGKTPVTTDPDVASCVATGLVSQLGLDPLKTYRLVKDTLEPSKKTFGAVAMSDTDAASVTDVLVSCLAPLDMIRISDPSGTMKKRQQRCLAKTLSEDSLKTLFVGFLTQSPAVDKTLTKAFHTCL